MSRGNVKSLQKWVDIALAGMRKAPTEKVRFCVEDFRDEQDRAAFLADGLTAPDGTVDLEALSDEQFYRAKQWNLLLKAQFCGDAAEERKVRRRLAMPLSELIEMFKALDLSMLPDDGQYPFDKMGHRYLMQNRIENGKVSYRDADQLWGLIEFADTLNAH